MERPFTSLSLSLSEELLLEDGWLGETEGDSVGGELVVAIDDGVELVLHGLNIEGIKQDDLLLLTISLHSERSFSDVGWEDNIVEDLLVDGGQGSGSRSNLGGMTLGTRADDGPVGNDNAGNLEMSLKSFLDDNTGLLESGMGAVRNADQEVLLVGAISLLVIDHLG